MLGVLGGPFCFCVEHVGGACSLGATPNCRIRCVLLFWREWHLLRVVAGSKNARTLPFGCTSAPVFLEEGFGLRLFLRHTTFIVQVYTSVAVMT